MLNPLWFIWAIPNGLFEQVLQGGFHGIEIKAGKTLSNELGMRLCVNYLLCHAFHLSNFFQLSLIWRLLWANTKKLSKHRQLLYIRRFRILLLQLSVQETWIIAILLTLKLFYLYMHNCIYINAHSHIDTYI